MDNALMFFALSFIADNPGQYQDLAREVVAEVADRMPDGALDEGWRYWETLQNIADLNAL